MAAKDAIGLRIFAEDDIDRSWFSRAACKGMDMFPKARSGPQEPERSQEGLDAEKKAICFALCPVRDECREFALRTREEHGVWGGMSAEERRLEIRRRVKAGVGTVLPHKKAQERIC